MAQDSALEQLAAQLALAFQPLVDATSSPASLNTFLRELGWRLDPVPASVMALQAPAAQLYAVLEENDDTDPAAVIAALRAVFAAISDISSAGGLPADFADEFPRQLVDYLLCEYLMYQQPRWGWLLFSVGIIRAAPVAAAPPRVAHVRESFATEDLGALISDPLAFLRNGYRWGGSDFRGEQLQQAFAGLAEAWGSRVRQGTLDADTHAPLTAGSTVPTTAPDTTVRLILIKSDSNVAF